MNKPFRKYKATIDWRDHEHGVTNTCQSIINLYDVKEWSTMDNEYFQFKDGFKRTAVTFMDGTMYKVRIPFEEFDTIMDNFLEDVKGLDCRSMHNFKKNVNPANHAAINYKGMMDFKFHLIPGKIIVNAYPKGTMPTTFEEAITKVLYSNITPDN